MPTKWNFLNFYMKIQDTVSHINGSMVQIKKAQKYLCLRVLSVSSFQTSCNKTKILPQQTTHHPPI